MRNKDYLTVLLTSVGGQVSPLIIKCLKSEENPSVRVVGVDAKQDAIGSYFCDAFKVVPYGTDKDYVPAVLEFAQQEKVDVIIPGSDEEVLALSKVKESFSQKGVTVACSEPSTVEIASDKLKMLSFLKDKGIRTPGFSAPVNISEFKDALYELGYPDHPVVFKPRRSRGGRGFWLITRDADDERLLLGSPYNRNISFKTMVDILSNTARFPEIILMEYLPGADFNVDVLTKSGESLYIIPNERLQPDAGPVEVGLIREDLPAKEMAEKVASAFGFDYLINIEMAYPRDEETGPLVYEINPRVSAPIAAYAAAGVNLLYMAVLLAANYDLPQNLEARETRMIRYWSDYYAHSQRRFVP